MAPPHMAPGIEEHGVVFALTGGAAPTWWVVPIMPAASFVTLLPYTCRRLKGLGKACH